MLNNTYVKREAYNSGKQILFAVEHQVSVGCVVSAEGATADSTGKKIVKAGTPMTGDLDNRTTAFKTLSGAGTPVGVLLHDVDVTVGDNNGTLLLFGFVNTNRLDNTTKAKITAEVKTALPMIRFVAC